MHVLALRVSIGVGINNSVTGLSIASGICRVQVTILQKKRGRRIGKLRKGRRPASSSRLVHLLTVQASSKVGNPGFRSFPVPLESCIHDLVIYFLLMFVLKDDITMLESLNSSDYFNTHLLITHKSGMHRDRRI